MVLLDGKTTAEKIKDSIKLELNGLIAKGHRKPHLAAILVGEDGASRTYVDSKERNSLALGYDSTILRLPADTTEADLLSKINEINDNPLIDGLLVQSPLPAHMNETLITQSISPLKDVDGFHYINMGKLARGDKGFVSATPLGIMMMLEAYNIPTSGKHCVVIGRSNIVGRPMSLLMSNNGTYGNCTVTLCHSKTVHIEHHTRQADILIVALGKPGFVKANMVKPGAVVIDVGITRVDDASRKSGFYLKGDVDFEEVKEVASYLTPVPGGVGLMTIAALLSNTFTAYKNNIGL
jgi:methylenetetrahydrofolate dehydrogenase (NADP+)/methenyltetrahydrofolate cyclohydrolase